jgi:hypothetical protein
MLLENDLRFDVGRAGHGGDFMRVTHLPTGLSRCHPGPLGSVNRHELVKGWLAEIEDELRRTGLSKYLVDDPLTGMPEGEVKHCLEYFRQAIQAPEAVAPWAKWWKLNEERVRRAFSREDYLLLKHRRLAGVEVVLKKFGWQRPPYLETSGRRSGALLNEAKLTQRFPCPSCGYFTLGEQPPGTYLICPVCSWEDDLVQFNDPDYQGGANVTSLNEAKANFRAFGARPQSDLSLVREPRDEELRP